MSDHAPTLDDLAALAEAAFAALPGSAAGLLAARELMVLGRVRSALDTPGVASAAQLPLANA